jgi:hypothetical protein
MQKSSKAKGCNVIMEKYLGRNPFRSKKKSHKKRMRDNVRYPSESWAEWLFIKIPAKALLFAIKTGALLKNTFAGQEK